MLFRKNLLCFRKHSADIGIAPDLSEFFNKSKSSLLFVEYSGTVKAEVKGVKSAAVWQRTLEVGLDQQLKANCCMWESGVWKKC